MGRIFLTLATAGILSVFGFSAYADEPTEASCQAAYDQAVANINNPRAVQKRAKVSDGKSLIVSSRPSRAFVMEGVRGPTVKRKAIEAAGEEYRECLASIPLPPNPDGTCPFGTYPVEVTPPKSFVALDPSVIRELKPIQSYTVTQTTPQLRAQLLQKIPARPLQVDRKTLEAKRVNPELTAKIAKPAPPKIETRPSSPVLKTAPVEKTKIPQVSTKLTERKSEVKLAPLLSKRLKVSPALMKAPETLKVETFKFEKVPANKIKDRTAAGAEIKCLRNDTNPQIFFSIIQLPKLHMGNEPIKVAFNGGSQAIRTAIYSIAQQWSVNTLDEDTGERMFTFDFGSFGSDGLLNFHEWSEDDPWYTAHIRISFVLEDGYWSYIGTDAANPEVVLPGEPSMNLGGMDGYGELPADWVKTIYHEFGHALGLEHEHQHPTSVCGDVLRLEDDEGYDLALDSYGTAVADKNGKRPGVLTYLQYAPNYWSREDAVFNLAQLQEDDNRFTTAFDPASIMRYEFPIDWYKDTAPEECLPLGSLPSTPSPNDYAALRIAYKQQLCPEGQTCPTLSTGPWATPEPE